MKGTPFSKVSFFLPVVWLQVEHPAEGSEEILGQGRVTKGNLWDFDLT